MYTMPARETVAGDATARSWTSKSSDMDSDMPMRSPLMSVRVLSAGEGRARVSHTR
jgi:hypothetical protein